MAIDFTAFWSDWMAQAAIGLLVLSGVLLAACSCCGICVHGDCMERKTTNLGRTNSHRTEQTVLRRAA
jgi:hypothetical protein